jgi:hypothetical protein
MSVTSLSANPFYEALALAALLLQQDEEMVASSTGNHLDARRLVFEAATPVSSRSDPNPGPKSGVGDRHVNK